MTVLLRSALLATLLMFAACQTTPPVQEMSDARQAIMVAKEAGAAEHAAEDLREAEEYLQSAEGSLSTRSYATARRDAVQAKVKAIQALRRSEAMQDAED
jgi:HAMP domain-containing protein